MRDAASAYQAILEIYDTVPDDELPLLDAVLAARFGRAGKEAATVAMADQVAGPTDQDTDVDMDPGVEVDNAEAEAVLFQTRVSCLLDPEARPDTATQLSVMTELLDKVGYKVPELSDHQKAKLAETAEANPSYRIVPTPLMSLSEREALAKKARKALPGQRFSTSQDIALRTPDDNWVSGELLRNPESTVTKDGKSYGLRYRTAAGEVVSREAYIADLKATGQAIEGPDGTIWTFPFMDVRVRTPRANKSAGNLLKLVDPIATPESLLVIQLLHQANGTPNPEWETDFANEGVYELELDNKGNPKATLVRVANVYWNPGAQQLNLDFLDEDFSSDFLFLGVRDAVGVVMA